MIIISQKRISTLCDIIPLHVEGYECVYINSNLEISLPTTNKVEPLPLAFLILSDWEAGPLLGGRRPSHDGALQSSGGAVGDGNGLQVKAGIAWTQSNSL